MVRLGVATVAAFLAFCLSAHAQVVVKSEDGSMQLTLPNGWKEGKPVGASTKIRASDGHGAVVAVSAHPKEDFKDFKAFTNFADERLKKNLPGTEAKAQNLEIDGKPAIRMTMSGTGANGRNVAVIATYVDAGPTYVVVLVRASASDYRRQEPVLVGLASQLKLAATAPAAQGKPGRR